MLVGFTNNAPSLQLSLLLLKYSEGVYEKIGGRTIWVGEIK